MIVVSEQWRDVLSYHPQASCALSAHCFVLPSGCYGPFLRYVLCCAVLCVVLCYVMLSCVAWRGVV